MFNTRLVTVRSSASSNISMRTKRKKWAQTKPFRVVRTFILLFVNTSSIHGFNQITAKKRHPIESFLWLVAISAAVWGSVKISLSTLERYQSSPTVVSIERNYHDWNTSFPAVAICPTAAYSEPAITQVLEKYPHVRDQSAFVQFFKELVSHSYLEWKDKLQTPFTEIHPDEFWKIAFDIRWKFTYNVSNSNQENFGVVNMRSYMTDIGICYSYNSLASPYSEKEYWESNNRTYFSDLPLFEGNPLDGDIFAQIMNMNSGYKLFLLDPNEVPDAAMKYIEAENNTYKTLDLTASSIQSDDSLRNQLSVKQRKCRFPVESELLTSPAYSYYRCRQECRMDLSMKLCGCVAYFYRPTKGFKYCDYEGYLCLGKHGSMIHFLADDKEKVKCDCLPLCSEATYRILIDNSMEWNLGTNLKWGILKYPKLRYKRDIIFGMSDLIVAIGGTAGLFLGCSLLSFAEIFYFFTVRLALFLRRHFHW